MEPKTKKLLNVKVFAQSSPNDNLLLVQALKKRGHIVAATGMGIHDPKTLREADVSLAMGVGGTAAAKENSDFIILDDNFATIVKVGLLYAWLKWRTWAVAVYRMHTKMMSKR
jgi:Ca2+-transporting ATPase